MSTSPCLQKGCRSLDDPRMAEERQLIEQAQAGDHDAFLALVARYDRQIMRVVYRFTADRFDREDLYQEVFLHCFRSLRRFRFASSLQTWLYRLALNRCLSYLQKRKKEPPAGTRNEGGSEIDWERRHKLDAVHRAMGRLRGRQRFCFHLHYIEGWSVDEIAAVLDCRAGTVKSHLDRARRRIRGDREVLAWRES